MRELPASSRRTLPARCQLTPPPGLRYRAHEAWERTKTTAEKSRRPCQQSKTPPFRTIYASVEWVCDNAGLSGAPTDPLALHQGVPPLRHREGDVRFVLDLPLPTKRTDPPDRRKEAALAALALLPNPDCTIWSYGSAKKGTIRDGGGAVIEMFAQSSSGPWSAESAESAAV